MGKKQHQKDRMFLTAQEWKEEWGGHKSKVQTKFRSLPFYCCGLSLQPFQDPVCTEDGTVFDIVNIVPYIQKYKCHPATGKPLKFAELIRLKFHKNADNEYHCPVLNKVFTPHTHIVAIRTTGNVYCHEAVKELCLKPKSLVDLLTDEPFERGDVIQIQDPADVQAKAIERFHYVKQDHAVPSGKGEAAGDRIKVVSKDARSILEQIAGSKATAATKQRGGGTERAAPNSTALADVAGFARKPGTATWDSSSSAGREGPQLPGGATARPVQTVEGRSTTGAVSRSFTSTSMSVQTVNERERVRKEVRPKEKGYVKLATTHGELNIELHCDIAPRTCENFIGLCERGYYQECKFHRSIKNFMIQGGDPTGTGRGGESIYGGPFKDELDSRLLHDKRGVVAMANRGKNTNTSQFYILYRPAKHLDYKHAVFGQVVGGLETLAAMEAVATDDGDRPEREISIVSARVFVDPYARAVEAEEREEVEKAKRKRQEEQDEADGQEDFGRWYSDPSGRVASQAGGSGGVGRYLQASQASKAGAKAATSKKKAPAVAKRAKAAGGYGNFDAW